MERGMGIGDRVSSAAVEGGVVALAEVVGLGGVAAEPLPVDLVEVVLLEHEGGHDALAIRGRHEGLDLAEKKYQSTSSGAPYCTPLGFSFSLSAALVERSTLALMFWNPHVLRWPATSD